MYAWVYYFSVYIYVCVAIERPSLASLFLRIDLATRVSPCASVGIKSCICVSVSSTGGRVSGKEKVESKNSNHTRREKKKGGETEPRRRLSGVTLPFFTDL